MMADRCGIAPGPLPFHIGETAAVRIRLADRRRFPFGLGGQPTLGPTAPSVRFVPVDENNGSVRRQNLSAVVTPPGPRPVRFRLPINRALGMLTLAPRPAGGAPEFPRAITARLDERRIFAIGDRCTRDAQRVQLDRVRPLLVVEDESFGAGSAEPPCSAGHVSVVTRQSAGG